MNNSKQPGLDLKKFLPYRLSVLEQQISQSIALQYSEQFGLTRIGWRVLATIAMFDGITASNICSFTHMEKMQVSRAINGLDKQKLIKQTKRAEDLRSVYLTLTAKGQKIYQKIVPQVLKEESKIFSALTNKELQLFEQLIHKLCHSLETDI